jgi:hypothetical protein
MYCQSVMLMWVHSLTWYEVDITGRQMQGNTVRGCTHLCMQRIHEENHQINYD